MMRRIGNSPVLAIALIVAMGAVYALIARFVLHGFPFSGDEYSISLQSEIFAKGMLRTPAPMHADWFGVDHVVIDQWVRSKYPPGASALLAIGQWLRAAWIITPIEGAITLALVWHATRRVFGNATALTAVVVLGLSPLFVCTATSFYAHTPTLMFLAAALAALVSWLQDQRSRWLLLTGAALGCAFLTRPFDAVLFGVAIASLRSFRAVAITALGALPFVGLNMLYQYSQFGSPFVSGYSVYEPAFRAIYGDLYVKPLGLMHFLSAQQQENHFLVLRQMFYEWTPIGAAVLMIFGRSRSSTRAEDAIRTLCVAFLVLDVLAFLFAIAEPDDGPRARYLTVALLPMSILAAIGLQRVWPWTRSKLVAAFMSVAALASVTYAVHASNTYLQDHAFAIWDRSGPYRLEAKVPRNAVVIVRATFPTRFARNGPFYDGVLYLSLPRNVSDEEVRAAFPDRPIWSAREARPWKFRRVQ